MIALILAVFFAVLYFVFHRRDARLLRNGVFLVAAIGLGLIGAFLVLEPLVPGLNAVLDLVIIFVILAIIVLAVALISNGFTMFRREGRSVGNLLSLVFGVLILAAPFVLGFLLSHGTVGEVTALFLGGITVYISLAFVSFTVYSVVYSFVRPAVRPAAIVVLGSGLINGEVPPLLRSRLDKGLQIYRKEKTAGRSAALIPSGGQGSDEPRPEGQAMAEYLIRQGAAPEDVFPENRAANTRENLLLSEEVQLSSARPGPVLAVTNEYHVLRTALIARSVGSKAQVVGSRTAFYYVPSAFLREFAAVMAEHKWLNVLAVATFAAIVGFGIWESLQMR